MTKTVQPVQRLYAHLDSIAVQRQVADVRRRQDEVRAAEVSVNVRPINPTGKMDPFMQAQVVDSIAQKREALRAAEALDGDERVVTYCQDIIGQAGAPLSGDALINGEPLLR